MFREVVEYRRANHVHLQSVLERILERGLRQRRRQTQATQFGGDLGMDQSEHTSSHGVFKVGYFSVALDLEAASGYLLRRLRLAAGNPPSHHWLFPLVVSVTAR